MSISDSAHALMTPGAGIVIENDAFQYPLLTGPTTMIEPVWDESGEYVVCSGLSDNHILWDYLAFPSLADWSAASGTAFSNGAFDIQEGICETVLKHYVSYNLLALERQAPDVPPITVAPDLVRGQLVNGRGRFQILGDLLQELAIVGGDLGFAVNNRQFDVSVPRDRRNQQVFSIDSGNLREYKPKIVAPSGTMILSAGGGEEEQRVFTNRRDLAAETKWGRHIEVFQDRRDTTDLAELAQAGDQLLLEKAELTAVGLRAIDVPNRRFGVDWNLGDYVTFENVDAVIREVKGTLDGDGATITPTADSMTSVSAAMILEVFDSVRRLRRRVSQLERTR
jgi:hypothetical protein